MNSPDEIDAMDDCNSSIDQDDSSSISDHPNYIYEHSDFDNIKPINTTRIEQIESAMMEVHHVIDKYGNPSLPSLNPNDMDTKKWKIDDDSPWADVPKAIKEIVSARESMIRALDKDSTAKESDVDSVEWWEPYLKDKTSNSRNDGVSPRHEALSPEEQKQFEQVHMEWATDAFAEELEALRNGTFEQKFGTKKKREELELDPTQHSFVVAKQKSSNENPMSEDVHVQVLADMIRSGGNVFSEVEKKMLVRARQRGDVNSQECDRGISLPIHELRRRKLGYS